MPIRECVTPSFSYAGSKSMGFWPLIETNFCLKVCDPSFVVHATICTRPIEANLLFQTQFNFEKKKAAKRKMLSNEVLNVISALSSQFTSNTSSKRV